MKCSPSEVKTYKSDAVQINGSEVTALAQPQFTGFTLSELVVLWRYRVRTA